MTNTSYGVIAIDDGGNSCCIATRDGLENFPSIKGYYGERNLTSLSGKYDYIVDYLNNRYVMGTLAKYDCTMPIQMHTKSKQNEFFDLSVLVAIHQFGYLSNDVVVSVPIRMHNDEEKEGRRSRLIGSHTVTVNGVTKTFYINDVKVAPESAVAYWVDQPRGKSRFLDIGSRTIGYATTVNEDGDIRFIDSESDTIFGKGVEALSNDYNAKGLADFICGRLSRIWSTSDSVYLLGGGALDEELVNNILNYFPNSRVMNNPKLINAIGMYNLGKVAFNSN